jgi:hypothetical protein
LRSAIFRHVDAAEFKGDQTVVLIAGFARRIE